MSAIMLFRCFGCPRFHRKRCNNTKFLSNQMGYKNECVNDISRFEPLKVFELEY